MSNLSKKRLKKRKKNREKFFVVCSGLGDVDSIFQEVNDEFTEIPCMQIRLDDLERYPLTISNHVSQVSSIINNEYHVNFVDELSEESFFNDLFYFIEELHDTPDDQRITSKRKDIDLITELEILQGEKDEKHDDIETDEKQSD